jgi:hypothetical protein
MRMLALLIGRVTLNAVLIGPLHQFIITIRPIPMRIVTVNAQSLARLETTAKKKCSGLIAKTLGPSISPATGIGSIVEIRVDHHGNVIIQIIFGGIESRCDGRLRPMTLATHH